MLGNIFGPAAVRAARQAAGDNLFAVEGGDNGQARVLLATVRDQWLERPDVDLLGLDHPLLVELMNHFRSLPAREIGVRVSSTDGRRGVLSLWHVVSQGDRGETRTTVLPLGVDESGHRLPAWERQADRLFDQPATSAAGPQWHGFVHEVIEPMIQRELQHRGIAGKDQGYDARLIGWVEVV